MPKEHPLTVEVLVGSVQICDLDSNCRTVSAPASDILKKAEEVLTPGKNSSSVVRINGRQLATIRKSKPSVPASVRTFHPLAAPVSGSKRRLRATAVKAGRLLVLQAQRDGGNEARSHTLIVRL